MKLKLIGIFRFKDGLVLSYEHGERPLIDFTYFYN